MFAPPPRLVPGLKLDLSGINNNADEGSFEGFVSVKGGDLRPNSVYLCKVSLSEGPHGMQVEADNLEFMIAISLDTDPKSGLIRVLSDSETTPAPHICDGVLELAVLKYHVVEPDFFYKSPDELRAKLNSNSRGS